MKRKVLPPPPVLFSTYLYSETYKHKKSVTVSEEFGYKHCDTRILYV